MAENKPNGNCWLMTIQAAAELLSISPWTIRRAIWGGQLRHTRFGRAIRIRAADLEEFVNQNTVRNGEKTQPKFEESRRQATRTM